MSGIPASNGEGFNIFVDLSQLHMELVVDLSLNRLEGEKDFQFRGDIRRGRTLGLGEKM